MIEDLELSVRSRNVLKAAGIYTMQDLLDSQQLELESLEYAGRKTYAEILHVVLRLYRGEILESIREFDGLVLRRRNAREAMNSILKIADDYRGHIKRSDDTHHR